MKILSKGIINRINQRTIESHGGNFIYPNNYLSEDKLDYLLEIIDSKIFGKDLYPKISDKAAIYMYNIISNHIYSDGNKRTGLEAAIIFLRLNKKNLNPKISNNEIYDFTMKVASGQSSLEECQAWFEKHIAVDLS